MSSQNPSNETLFISVLILFILVIFWKMISKIVVKSPPGPWKLPMIGNLHQLVSTLPHRKLRDLAKQHGPIMHLKMGQLETIIISSAKGAQEVLKTHELSLSQRPQVLAVEVMSYGQSSVVFAPYGDFWRELRKISVCELLSAKRVQSFRSIREEEVWSLVESVSNMSPSSSFNFSEKIFALTYGIVSRAAFGKKCSDQVQKEFTSLVEEAIKLAAGFDVPDLFPSLKFLGYVTGSIPAMRNMRDKLGIILDGIINDHIVVDGHDNDNEDFVDVLLRLQQSNKLGFDFTTSKIKDVIMDFFSAGSETSATTTEWAMSELMRNPEVMKKAQAEVRQLLVNRLEGKKRIEEADVQTLDYLKAVVKETLRLHPTIPLIPREARERCEISGYQVAVKTKVIVNEWAMGRDAENWVDPESFKPERFLQIHGDKVSSNNIDFKGSNFEFIPFGAGRRICPGISFATAMIELALSQLLYHFDWKLPNGIKPDELDMSETFGVTCRRKNDLYLIATPH
ncbi:desmethyl-deoxy-podophyllotoxin synthase [Rosa sericea]